MSLPSRADLWLYQGDTWTATVQVLPDDGEEAPDISGHVPMAHIRTAPADEQPVVAATILAAVTGPDSLSLALSADDTLALAPGGYVWDLQLADGEAITTILAGRVAVTAEVTRP